MFFQLCANTDGRGNLVWMPRTVLQVTIVTAVHSCKSNWDTSYFLLCRYSQTSNGEYSLPVTVLFPKCCSGNDKWEPFRLTKSSLFYEFVLFNTSTIWVGSFLTAVQWLLPVCSSISTWTLVLLQSGTTLSQLLICHRIVKVHVHLVMRSV